MNLAEQITVGVLAGIAGGGACLVVAWVLQSIFTVARAAHPRRRR